MSGDRRLDLRVTRNARRVPRLKPLFTERFEIIPIRGVEAQLATLPRGSTVTVTSSPRFGFERTLEYVEMMSGLGLELVPHLSARQVVDRAHLLEIRSRLGDLGVREIFVVGGDEREAAGPYQCAYDLLRALADGGRAFDRVGVACYPEGHPIVSDARLRLELRRKEPLADYMVSQICFDPESIVSWLSAMRRLGLRLPLYVGVPGVVRRSRLLELSFRLGVGTSARFLSKQRRLGSALLARRRTYRPDDLLDALAPTTEAPELGVAGYHLYTFNEVARTVAWAARRTHKRGSTPRIERAGLPRLFTPP